MHHSLKNFGYFWFGITVSFIIAYLIGDDDAKNLFLWGVLCLTFMETIEINSKLSLLQNSKPSSPPPL